MTTWAVEYVGFMGRTRRVFSDKVKAFKWAESVGLKNYVIYRKEGI